MTFSPSGMKPPAGERSDNALWKRDMTVLDRIPEPDLMDDRAQAEAYDAADFSEPHNAFVEHFKKCFPSFGKGHVLDLGCGTADVIIRFAKAFPETDILGIDGAQSMLDIGQKNIRMHGVDGQIRLKKHTIPYPGLSKNNFDAVISNSLLHHLADPLLIWQVIRQYAGPGAPVYIMDLLRPDNTDTAKKFVRMYAADAPRILQEDFFNSLLASYTADEIRQQLLTVRMDYFNMEVISDRHIVVWGEKQ